MRSFDVFFDLRLNKWLSKQSWAWWFETPSRPLWRNYNENARYQANPKIPEPRSRMHDHTYIYHKPDWLLQQFEDWATRESHPETPAVQNTAAHDDVIKWKYFPRYWPFVRELTGPGEFPTQRPVTRRFDVLFDLRLNKRLSKRPWGWWFETPSHSLWRQIPDPGSHMHDHTYIFHKPDWLLQQFEDWATRESHPETTACAKHSCSWWRHQMGTFSA